MKGARREVQAPPSRGRASTRRAGALSSRLRRGILYKTAQQLGEKPAKGMNGGPDGDLYITFNIANDVKFKRSGNDLHTSLDIPLYTAILGGEVMFDTLDGKIKLKVPPETQNGAKTRIKGKGFPVYKKEADFGDLYITYNIIMPANLTDKQKELFAELAKLSQ